MSWPVKHITIFSRSWTESSLPRMASSPHSQDEEEHGEKEGWGDGEEVVMDVQSELSQSVNESRSVGCILHWFQSELFPVQAVVSDWTHKNKETSLWRTELVLNIFKGVQLWQKQDKWCYVINKTHIWLIKTEPAKSNKSGILLQFFRYKKNIK